MKKILAFLCIFVLIFASCEDNPPTSGTTDPVDNSKPCTTVAFDEEFNENEPMKYFQAALDTIDKQFEDGGQYYYSFDFDPLQEGFLSTILFNSRADDCNNYGLIRSYDTYSPEASNDLTAFSIIDDTYKVYNTKISENGEEITLDNEIIEIDDLKPTFETMNASFITENMDVLKTVEELTVVESSIEYNSYPEYQFTIDSVNNGEVQITVGFDYLNNVIIFEYNLGKSEDYKIAFELNPDIISSESDDLRKIFE